MPEARRPSAEEIIRYEKDPKTKIATITFTRPDYLNAPPTAAARLRYSDLLYQAGVDDQVKVVVIRGAGEDLAAVPTCPSSWNCRTPRMKGRGSRSSGSRPAR